MTGQGTKMAAASHGGGCAAVRAGGGTPPPAVGPSVFARAADLLFGRAIAPPPPDGGTASVIGRIDGVLIFLRPCAAETSAAELVTVLEDGAVAVRAVTADQLADLICQASGLLRDALARAARRRGGRGDAG